jgi:hypothetical protein
VKIGNPANYYVQVWPAWWDEPDDTAALMQDMFEVVLNMTGRVVFVPSFADVPRPWHPDGDEPTTVEEARIELALSRRLTVTPDDTRAGHLEELGKTTLFYVTEADFAAYRTELHELVKSAATTNPRVRHDDVAGLAVIRLIDDRVLSHISPSVIAR